MTKIYILMHKPDNHVLKIKDPIYIPFHCGKKTYVKDNDKFLPELGDDIGDNISNKNPYYSELTGHYWIWKNDTSLPDDIIGTVHYRRYFSEPVIESEEENELLSEETINRLLQDNDFIICGIPTDYDTTKSDDESAYSTYGENHIIEDLDNALKHVKILFPDLYETINHEVRHSGSMCLCNMMITRKKYFDEYCNFIFTVFKQLEYDIDFDDQNHQGYNQRVFGFLSERLFRPWLKAKGYTGIQGRGLDWEKYSGYVWE